MVEAPQPLVYSKSVFWEPDSFEKLLPSTPGFISDFVLSLRGQEVPVAFSIWSALVALSTVLKRETWLRWSDDHLYGNIYLVLVAPAGMAKKSVPINQAVGSIEMMGEYLNEANVSVRKQVNIFRDKITGEGIGSYLSRAMRPKLVPLVDAHGKPLRDETRHIINYERCAEVLLVAPELGTMLSRAKYNEDLITTLTKLYDTESAFEVRTKSTARAQKLTNPYACLLGGTTPEAMRDSIPKSAVSEGFLSRLILCYQSKSANLFHRPHSDLIGIPRKEIASRLAWLAQATVGQWDLTEEADEFFEQWYIRLHTKYDTLRFHSAQKSRFAIHVLKVAMLFSAQVYQPHNSTAGRVVTLTAVKDAIRLVEETMASAVALIEETEANPVQRLQIRTLNYIRERKHVSRKQLLQNMHLTASEATAIISDLFAGGFIRCWKNGTTPSFGIGEEYAAISLGRNGKETV